MIIQIELSDYAYKRLLSVSEKITSGSGDRSLSIDLMHSICQATLKSMLGGRDRDQLKLFGESIVQA